MKCENVLCREKSLGYRSCCRLFDQQQIEECFQYQLFDALQVVAAAKSNISWNDLIHDAANKLQVDTLNK